MSAARRRLAELLSAWAKRLNPEPELDYATYAAACNLLETQMAIDRFKRGEPVGRPFWPYYESFATDA